MCGFLVYVGRKINESKFNLSLNTLDHRGPDDSRKIHLNNISLGFKRLSIQDLSDASMQPMKDPTGNIVVYNGEVYNFKKLRATLESKGYIFKTSGDVEVIMKSFIEWGFENSIKKFEGMFSIVYFSNNENKIYATKDFFGMKPLFFSKISSDEFLLSSEIKAILKYKSHILSFQNSINPIFFTGLSPKGKTMFEGIFSVNQGDLLQIDLNNYEHSISTIFKLESLIDESIYNDLSKMNLKKLSEIYSSELNQSIIEHSLSDAKLGVLFSAGLDSSIIAGELFNKGVDVDLFKYENNDFSDKKYTKSFLNFTNQNLYEVNESDQDFIYGLPRLIYHYETINKSEGIALSKACKLSRDNGYKALLTGDSADELFGGYSSAQEYFTKSFITNISGFYPLVNLFNKVIPGFKDLFSADLNHYISPFSSEFFDTFLDFSLYNAQKKKQINNYRESYGFLNSKNEIASNAFMLDEIANRLERFLIRADRFGMMESIELRIPFLTIPLVKLAINTPYYKKTRFKPSLGSKTLFSNKIILKKIAESKNIPRSIINRKKIGTLISNVNFENELYCFKHISLKNVSEFLMIGETDIKESILLSNNKWELRRQIWNFLSLEFMIEIFINDTHYTVLEERIMSLVNKKNKI